MVRILCFGDSNTFGTNPEAGGRIPSDQRWTGVLQRELGLEYEIIEEGCGGRTTCFDDPLEPGRNGLAILPILISSHKPLDLVIIMLGTNDLKQKFSLTKLDLQNSMRRLIDAVRSFDYGPFYPEPQIMIVAPPLIKEGVERGPYGMFSEHSAERSTVLAPLYKALADEQKVYFLDAGQYCEVSDKDKLHMDAANHKNLALAIAAYIHTIFGESKEIRQIL